MVVWLCFCCDTFLHIVVDIMLLWSGIAGQLSFTKTLVGCFNIGDETTQLYRD